MPVDWAALSASLTLQLSRSIGRNAALHASNLHMRKALDDIRRATIEGKVCDDVAWFDTITTLHDFVVQAIDHADKIASREP